ncbi:NACHT C-terminal helical domain 2-containing protein [Floridanema evergladense]|uniref:NACHT conflict system C-terminal helical domain-containing protein n=1 Tax=Floridaenema evergladense BLCC-F167 TaxID=3153639 RepID=A0ABV4WMV9_9CYAN
MLPNADCLLLLMKHQIDLLVAAEQKLQQFLMWVKQKSLSVYVNYKPAAVRSFYLAFGHNLDLTLARAVDANFKPVNFLLADFIDVHILAFERGLTIDLNCALDLSSINYNFNLHVSYNVLDFLFIPHSYQILEYIFYPVFENILVSELRQEMQQLKEELPNPIGNREMFRQWWQDKGQAWAEKLKAVMIKYCNIGHNWQFSEHQKRILNQYYDANKLLVDCLNSSCNVSPKVREEVEISLLLPKDRITNT